MILEVVLTMIRLKQDRNVLTGYLRSYVLPVAPCIGYLMLCNK